MKKIGMVLLVLGLIVALPVALRADFNSKKVKKAGFAAKKGQYDGKALTPAQKQKIKDAIGKIRSKGGKADKACADKLDDMLKRGRICAEGGSSTSTTTLPDGKPGAGGDGINIPPGRINDPDKLVGTLCHEWVHVGQTGPYPEGPAYAAGKKWLGEVGMKPGDPYYDWYCCKVQITNKDPAKKKKVGSGNLTAASSPGGPVPVSLTPDWGFVENESADGVSLYGVNESSPMLISFTMAMAFPNSYFLSMGAPLNLKTVPGVLGPNGGRVLVATGVDFTLDGVLEYLEVDDTSATVLGTLARVTLPASDLFDVAFDPAGGRAWVLDTAGQRIVEFFDTDGDGLPDTPAASDWANAAGFPALASALSIHANLDTGNSVVLGDADVRMDNAVDLDEPQTALYDTDADGLADASISYVHRDGLFIIPGPSPVPAFGESLVEVFATSGSTVELWSSDASGAKLALLGSVTLGPNSNSGTLSTGTTFASGDWLLLDDVAPAVPFTPHSFQVAAVASYGSSCGGSLPAPHADWAGDGSIGSVLTPIVLGAPPLSSATLVLGFTPLSVDLAGVGAPGCTLLTTLDLLFSLATDADGAASVDLKIPNKASLIGFPFFEQWAVVAPGANPLGVVLSDGIAVTVAP